MKKIKKKYKILISIVVLVLLIPPFNYFVMRDSVMEDIYRNVYWGDYGRINRMEGIEFLDYKDIEIQIGRGDGTWLWAIFDEKYLTDNFSVSLFLPSREEIDNDTISIVGVYEITDNVSVRMGMQYDHKTRTMTYEPIYIVSKNDDKLKLGTKYYDEPTITQYLTQYGITQEDIKDYQHYILYDVVYQSWVSGTDNGRKLNKWDYRNIKEVDNTFNFEVVE